MKKVAEINKDICLYKGDKLSVVYYPHMEKQVLLEYLVKKPVQINKIEIHYIEDELDFKSGYCIILGEK